MDKVNLPCSLETRISKDGKEYKCFVIHICEGYDKIYFPEPADKVLIDILFSNNSSKSTNKISINRATE